MTDKGAEAIVEAAHHWRATLWRGGTTEADRKAFADWLAQDPRHEAAYARASTVWAALGGLDPGEIEDRHKRKALREWWVEGRDGLWGLASRRPLGAIGALAACAAVFLAAVLFSPQMRAPSVENAAPAWVTFETGVGDVQEVRLSDGSVATLGAASRLDVRIAAGERRLRLLDGAAYFDVAPDPDRPFAVEAGDLRAVALGTEYAVRHSAGVTRVSVAEGRVEVSYPVIVKARRLGLRAAEELTAGEQVAATSAAGLSEVTRAPLRSIGAFREKRLVYAGAALSEIVADARRYSHVPVEYAPGESEDAFISASFRGDQLDRLFAKLPDLFPVAVDLSDPSRIRIEPAPDERRGPPGSQP